MTIIVCLSILALSQFCFVYSSAPTISTLLGKVAGKQIEGVDAYLGIPFAEAPVGRLRFRPPLPKRPWFPSIYNGTKFGAECLQSEVLSPVDDHRFRQNEDCLYLNIWRPAVPAVRLPVMVWFYGGAFMHGASSRPEYGGVELATRGVVVVSFNYRVGAFGFLVSTSDGLYGNYGLNDQKVALQWIQDNIHAFGGDPNRVTLFGESAGAMSIGLHMLDQEHSLLLQFQQHQAQHRHRRSQPFGPTNVQDFRRQRRARTWEEVYELIEQQRVQEKSSDPAGENQNQSSLHSPAKDFIPRKLFSAVIMQSNPLGYRYRSITIANFIGRAFKELLDCDDLRCLQSEAAEELLHVQDTLMAVPRSIGDFFTWGPVLTDHSYDREIRLAAMSASSAELVSVEVSNITVRQPIDTLRTLRRLPLPVILGTNQNEGHVFVYTAFPARMSKLVYQGLVWSFFRSATTGILRQYQSKADALSASRFPDYREVLAQIIGDYLFDCPTKYFASQLADMGTAVYLYKFSLKTRTPGFPCCDGLSCHTCEIPYVFNNLDVIAAEYSFSYPSPERTVATSTVSQVSQGHGQGLAANFEHWMRRTIDARAPPPLTTSYHDDQIDEDPPGLELHTAVSARDVRVAELMTSFWVTFAVSGSPNGDSAIVMERRRQPVSMSTPWWPRLLGESLNRIGRPTLTIPTLPLQIQHIVSGDNNAHHTMQQHHVVEESGNLLSSVRVSPGEVLVEQQRALHELIIDENSEIFVIEKDCICSSWNELEYRF